MKPNMVVMQLVVHFGDSTSNYYSSVYMIPDHHGNYTVLLRGANNDVIFDETYYSQNAAFDKYIDICNHIDQYVKNSYEKWDSTKKSELLNALDLLRKGPKHD